MRMARIVLIAALSLGFSTASLAEDEVPAEEPGWTGSVSLGGSLSAGTTNTFSGNLSIDGEREFGANLVRLGLDARYGTTKTKADPSYVTQTDEQKLTQYLRHSPSDRFYIYGESEEARDSVRNIDERFLVTVGPGYKVWGEEDGAFLDLEGGIGYRYENYGGLFDPLPGGPGNLPIPGDGIPLRQESRNDITGRAAFNFKDKFGAADFGQTGEFILPFNDTSGWLARAETKLSFPVLESWSFVNTLGLEYNNAAAVGTKKFELDYVVSLEYKF